MDEDALSPRSYAAGEIIIRQGDPGHAAYLVVGGAVEVVAEGASGERALSSLGVYWFEEPVAPYDYHGSARVAAALDTPIASGETEATRYGFRSMLEAGAADIWMADLGRVGGVTEFVKVAHLAAAHDIAISNHLFTEQSLCLLGAFANATWLEFMPWTARLYREAIAIEDGHVAVPDRPGLGFTFDLDAVERHRIR